MNTAMTLSELMTHFSIDERYYDRVSQWLCENAELVLHESNNGKKRNRVYDVDKVSELYPHKHVFNSIGDTDNLAAAAELLAEAINEEYDKHLTADDILRGFAKSADRRYFISQVRNTMNELSDKHEDVEKWYERIEYKYVELTKRLTRLTIASIVTALLSIVTLVVTLFV